jgi:hypothetical protein
MKSHSLLLVCAISASAFISPAAHAMISDSLSGPDTSVVQSALTAPSQSGEVLDIEQGPQIWSWSSRSYGNSRFGASYSTQGVTAAWSAGQSLSQNYVSTSVTAFGTTKDVLQATIYAETNGPTQTAHVRGVLYVLGNAVRDTDKGGGDYTVAPTNVNGFSQKLYDTGTQTFWIGPIPVSVGASISANAWQSVKGHVWVDGIDATLSQGAGLSATAFGGVGPSWANAGIKVKNLSLLSGSIDLTSKGRYAMFDVGNGNCGALYNAAHDYGSRLRELDGSIVLYASAFGYSDEYNVFTWQGFSQYFPIYQVAPFTRALGDCFAVPQAPEFAGYIIG